MDPYISTSKKNSLLRGVSVNYLHLIVNGLILLALTPVMLHYLGESGYGLWAAFMSVMGYFVLFNLGLTSATTKYTAELNELNQQDSLNRIVSTVFLLFLGIGLLLALLCFGAAPFIPQIFHVPTSLEYAGSLAFSLMGLAVAFRIVGGVFGSVIYGYERIDLFKAIGIVQLLTNGALVVTLLTLGFGLVGVAVAFLSSVIIQGALYVIYLRLCRHNVIIHPRLANFATFKKIAPYSTRSFLLNLTSRLLYQTDSLVIGIFLGANKVASYAIAYNLVFQMTYMFSLISETLFPRFSSLFAAGAIDELRTIFLRVTKLSVAGGTILCLFLIFLGHEFINIWVGNEHFVGANVFLVFIVMVFVHAIGTPAGLLLQGIGENKGFIYSESANAFINLLLSILLVREAGILGVALGTVIAHGCTSSWIVPLLACRHIKLKIHRFFFQGILRPALLGLPTGAIVWIINDRMVLGDNLTDLILKSIVIIAIYLTLYIYVGCDKKERELYGSFINQMKKRRT